MQSDCTVLCRGLPQSELRSIVEEGLEYEKILEAEIATIESSLESAVSSSLDSLQTPLSPAASKALTPSLYTPVGYPTVLGVVGRLPSSYSLDYVSMPPSPLPA
eukprot:CAMPEP_0182464958 /NCGR_PEP_ID=MMETSP1319-20130603/8925_1 /TAXON_ID=172717 /ORGANISM="Bolidomonas pacifica, Strain RCC208" /LENGTH=103 /DNA_ID=CAMNT_0024664635 /DNA_START=221 /DNA_END=529 /DNA_ORIENTATION=+